MSAYIVSAEHLPDGAPLYFCKYELYDLRLVRFLICIPLGNNLLKCIYSTMQIALARQIHLAELGGLGESLVVHKHSGKEIISEEEYKYYSILVYA